VVFEPRLEPFDHGVVGIGHGRLDRLPAMAVEDLLAPAVARDADDPALELAALLEPVERLEGHLAGEIAGDPEDHQGVGATCHRAAH
jgi:hypothetical protein